jgi:hypothetical protein
MGDGSGRARDPWDEALRRHVSGAREEEPATSPRRGVRLGVPWLVALGVAVLALAGAAAYLGWVADENAERAERWRERSVVLQDLVADRTRALNRQTARLNAAADRLQEARDLIARSEEDVAALELRQRELADEKAQVEDERAALIGVATRLEDCNEGLADLLQVVASDLPVPPAEVDRVAAACSSANQAVAGYVGRYGGG